MEGGSVDPHDSIGALTIREQGFWDMVYYNDNKDPPQNSIGNYFGPYIRAGRAQGLGSI